jgi:hypothetical protein
MGNTVASTELVEGRALTKRNTVKSTTVRTQGRVAGSFGLDGVRQKRTLLAPETRSRSRMRKSLLRLWTDLCGGCRETGIPTATFYLPLETDRRSTSWNPSMKKNQHTCDTESRLTRYRAKGQGQCYRNRKSANQFS